MNGDQLAVGVNAARAGARMEEVQTSSATESQLNWLVASCTVSPDIRDGRARFWLHRNNHNLVCVQTYNLAENPKGYEIFAPATEKGRGMPLLVAQGIQIRESAMWGDFGDADHRWAAASPSGVMATGPTELIAGLRCWIASKLGDAVKVPAVLAQANGRVPA